jgi:hypothetical protein
MRPGGRFDRGFAVILPCVRTLISQVIQLSPLFPTWRPMGVHLAALGKVGISSFEIGLPRDLRLGFLPRLSQVVPA